MAKRGKPITAAELMEQLNKDPEFLARKEAAEKARQKRVDALRAAERPLVQELIAAGFEIESVWDFVNTSKPYPTALPILIRHLQMDYPDRVREGIARSLAVREARKYRSILLDQFEKHEDTTGMEAKWGIACALSATTDDSVIDEVMEIVRDPRHGANRIAFLTNLARSKKAEARALLVEMASDAELGQEATRILEKRRHDR